VKVGQKEAIYLTWSFANTWHWQSQL